jgi:zinc/manganese transport system substrate-binding protein
MPRHKPLVAALWLLALLALLTACGGADVAAPAATAQPQSPAAAPTAAVGSAPTTVALEPTAAPTPELAAEKLDIVATFSILGDLVQNVGGDRIALHTLVGPGGDAHTFEPSPADSVALVEADLIFENGLAFEPWLDDLYTSSGSQATRVVVTGQVEPIKAEEGDEHAEEADEHTEEDEHAEEGDEHGHGEFDPHVWSDAGNTILVVETVRDALAKADPANADAYKANAEQYLAQLKTLDDFIVAETNKLPQERRKLVTSHDTFGYFAKRYGYEIVGTALGSVSTETADPSAGELAELIEQIKTAGVSAIFAENIENSGLMNQLASEAGVTLGPTLYTDALGEPGSDGDTYLKMMRYNSTAIVTALSK